MFQRSTIKPIRNIDDKSCRVTLGKPVLKKRGKKIIWFAGMAVSFAKRGGIIR
jgi:hypothetical protein